MARILLAEDDASARTLLSRALRNDGHQVIEFEDGQSALARLMAEPSAVDLLVSDVEMPGMDGITLATNALKANPSLRILLMSGYAGGLDRASNLFAAGVRCLPKPASLENVRDEVRAIISA